MKYFPITRYLLLLVGCAADVGSVFARGGEAPKLEEVVVTSQFRKAGLHDVPISITAISADTIKDTRLLKVEDLTTLVPNFTYTETGISTNFYFQEPSVFYCIC